MITKRQEKWLCWICRFEQLWIFFMKIKKNWCHKINLFEQWKVRTNLEIKYFFSLFQEVSKNWDVEICKSKLENVKTYHASKCLWCLMKRHFLFRCIFIISRDFKLLLHHPLKKHMFHKILMSNKYSFIFKSWHPIKANLWRKLNQFEK